MSVLPGAAVAGTSCPSPNVILADAVDLLRAGRKAEALDALAPMLAPVWCGAPADRRLLREAAVLLRRHGLAAQALALLAPLHRDHPKDAGAALELGHTLAALEDSAGALVAYAAAIAAKPSYREAHTALIKTLWSAGQQAEALEACDTARRLCPAERSLALRQAGYLLELGRPSEAVALLAPLQEAAPEDRDVSVELARALRLAGQEAAGDALLDRLLAAAPDDAEAWLARIEVLMEHGDAAALRQAACELHARLNRTGDGRLAAGLASLLPRLDITGWRPEAASWVEACAAQATHLKSSSLWKLYDLAELLGRRETCDRLLTAILDKPLLSLALAKQILRWSLALPSDQGLHFAPLLRRRLASAVLPVFDLEYAALTEGPACALRGRQRGKPRTPQEIVEIGHLLLQLGQRDLALRYLGFARRFWPAEPLLRRRHMDWLAAAGRSEAARLEAERYLANPDTGVVEDRVAAINALISIGEAARALAFIEASQDHRLRKLMAGRHQNLLVRFGRADQARALLATAATFGNARRSMHFRSSLHGLLMTDLEVAQTESRLGDKADDVCADAMRFVGPSIQTIDQFLARRASPSLADSPAARPIPRVVLQYWSLGEPPASLQAIMQSWRAVPDATYVMFNRRTAAEFLRAEFGAEWAAALLMTRHAAEESDFFRLCFLAAKGGIYADSDDRLISPLDALLARHRGLVVFQEPMGAIANNLILAAPAHPVLAYAAVEARQAIMRRDNESIWAKTGPGLLTRAVARACREASPGQGAQGVTILPFHEAARHVQCHIPLPYKQTTHYWNAATKGSHLTRLAPPSMPGQAAAAPA